MTTFRFDAFLSYSSRDAAIARQLAKSLLHSGIRLWFDEWAIKPGDNIAKAVDEGLEGSRVLILCLSPSALGTGWVELERMTVPFRDAANVDRQFVILRITDCTVPSILRDYNVLDFRQASDSAFDELLKVLRPDERSQRPRAQIVKRTTMRVAKSYVAYPKPLRSLATSNWRVADLCAAYDIPKGTLPGGGVIGILELGGGYTQADLDKFSANNGLPNIVVTDVPVGGANSPGGTDDAEVLLDIQVAAAVYYYATGTMPTIKVFWAPNDFKSFEAVVVAAVDEGCDVLSTSWGADENRWEQTAPGAAQSLEAAVAQAAERGLSVFAAAGDNASGDGDPGANVDMPSACPHIIACGGTTKFEGSEEVVWGNGNPDGDGTGGGYSNIFPMPAWQSGHGAPPGSNWGRMVPDVAADADPQTGYLVVINGVEQAIGGSSAPLYSGLFASFGKGLRFVGETLWQNPQAFTDIVRGSNGDFSAAPGPDPCAGLGVLIGTGLAAIFPG